MRLVLLAKDKENRVEQIKELGDPVVPAHVQLVHCLWTVVAAIRVLPVDEALAVLAVNQHQTDKVAIDQGHGEVVEQHDWLQVVKGLSIAHHSRPQGEGKVQVEAHEGQQGIGRHIDEGKVRRPRILCVDPVLIERVT